MTDQPTIEPTQEAYSFPASAMPPPMPAEQMLQNATAMGLDPMGMLAHAILHNAPIAVLDRLFDLRVKVEAWDARRAFNAALAKARGSFPVITKNRQAGFETKAAKAAKAAGRTSDEGRVSYAYEDLGQVAAQIDPILAEHGLSWRHTYDIAIDRPVSVTCIVFHEKGHEERVTLIGPRDDSGKKNALQQMGSTLSYLRRYTLMAALGLASAKDDDDAAISDEPDEQRVSPVEVDKRIADYKARMAAATDHESLNAVGLEINREPKPVQDGLRAAWKDELARITPPAAKANGNGRVQAPPPPAEGEQATTPAFKPGDAAWMKHVRGRFAQAKDRDELAIAWETNVDSVTDQLPDHTYNELIEGFNARKMELTP